MIIYMKLLIFAVIISVVLFPVLVSSRTIKCDQLSGKCINGEEKEIMNMRLGLDVSSRRILQASRYISYEALKKNLPDNRRGEPDQRDNPYRRSCDVHSHCYRFTN
ncbi:Protein RALF-like 14 [Arabidopsis thaliana]|nr:Rapid ALkalinization Factor [Arabidopsis thaliana x Arabidopsis arenosa]